MLRKFNFNFSLNIIKSLKKYKLSSRYTLRHRNTLININNNKKIMEFKILETPEKSEFDLKDYRLIELKNGLKALLIHDPSIQPTETSDSESEDSTDAETDSQASSETESESEGSEDSDNSEKLSAVALTVDVGSFSDPIHVQGLSHFLEHMIFMGSEKYPKENEFDSYIKKCGGSDNADTDCEETSFYFEVSESDLEGAIDRFSALFISPLLHREAMTREREAVESEFQMRLQNDSARRDQLIAEMGNEQHPSKLFTWGNLKTLKERIDDQKLYEEVQAFQKRHYSAHRMYVAIQSRVQLDDLQNLIVKYFSQIPSNQLDGLDFTKFNHENAFCKDFYDKIFYIRPTANICKLELTWCLPSFFKDYLIKPHHYAAYILGYEGKGSLCSYLRQKLWGLDVITGIDDSGFEHNRMYSLFSLTIKLTDKGFENIESVLKAVFWFIHLLKVEDLESRFNELQIIENTSFKYQSEQDPIDNVEELVVNMKYYPSKHILKGPHLYFKYDSELVKEMANYMNSRMFNIMIWKKTIPNINFDKREFWFGTEYTTRDIPESWNAIWNNSERVDELYLSEPNPFITNDFSLLKAPENQTTYPEQVFSNDVCELWYKQDTTFNKPIAFMYFYLISPEVCKSAKNSALLNLYSLILRHNLVEELYSADVANLNYETYSSENGLVIKVYGYNEKLHMIVDIITKKLSKFLDITTSDIFDTFKIQLMKNYSNSIIKPKALNKEIRLSVIENIRWTSYDKYNVLDQIKLSDLKEFGKKFLSKLKITSIIQGNVTREHAADVMHNVYNNLACESIKDISLIRPRTVKLPIGEKYIRVKTKNQKDCNTITTNFYQVGPSTIKLTSMLDLLVMLLEEPLFDILRTKEQLGYDISCSVRDNFSILGYSITINSQETKFKCCNVEKRIEEFRKEFLDILKNMPNDDFNQTKESLIKLNQMVDTKLKDEVVRNWAEVTTQEYIFDRREKEIKALQTLTQEEFIKFYEELIENIDCVRKLSIQVIGKNSSEPEIDDEHDSMPASYTLEFDESFENELNNIIDIKNFKKELKIYPITKTKF